MFCRKCGKEVPDDSEFCYKCGTRIIDIQKGSQSENKPISLDKPVTVSASHPTRSAAPPAITSRKCESCGELVYNNQRSCHECGAPNTSYNSLFDNIGEVPSRSTSSPQQANTRASSNKKVPYKYSKEYQLLKKRTMRAVQISFVVVLIFCIASGHFNWLGGLEMEYEITAIGGCILGGWAVGSLVVRAIFLAICKSTHE